MPVMPARRARRTALSPRWRSLLAAGTLIPILLGLAALSHPAGATLPAMGTCCLPTGACAVTLQADCAGTWADAGRCDPNPCPPATGACCLAFGTCLTKTLAECSTAGGIFLGNTSTCLLDSCPPPMGSCCRPTGACSVTWQSACVDSAGTTWTSDSVCTPVNPCQQPLGSCCKSTGVCSVTLKAGCVGTWKIFGGCDPNPCPQPGSCCFPNGACLMTLDTGCAGIWTAAGTCTPSNPCVQPPNLERYQFLRPDTTGTPSDTLLPAPHPGVFDKTSTIILDTWWTVSGSAQDADRLTVTADFSRLDPGGHAGNQALPAQSRGGGRYRVTYPLSGRASRRDSSGILIPFTAEYTANGHLMQTVDRRIGVCLSNHPPEHMGTQWLEPKSTPYRVGDSLHIETIWKSPDGLGMRVWPNLSSIVHDPTKGPPKVEFRRGDERGLHYLIHYRLPFNRDDLLPDGNGKLIQITAQDTNGCGTTTVSALWIDIDTVPPPFTITLDPLPSVASGESLAVSGEAPQAAIVLLLRERSVRTYAFPDSATGRFSGMIDLSPGENKIQVRASDSAGNLTELYPESPGIIVTRTEAAELSIGTPYSRTDELGSLADDIALHNTELMQDVVLRIFNLEGDCIWEERPDPTVRYEHRFHWTGTDRSGERAPQGYYLVRAEWRGLDGRGRSITKGLLLRD
jgi:hypothetical protein